MGLSSFEVQDLLLEFIEYCRWRCSQNIMNFTNLIQFITSGEEWPKGDNLKHDTTWEEENEVKYEEDESIYQQTKYPYDCDNNHRWASIPVLDT